MTGKPFVIGVFISSPSVGLFIKKLASQEDHVLQVSYKSLEEAIPEGKKMEEKGVEVVISRRGSAFLLRESLGIPVLSLPQTSIDILNSIREASLKGKRIFMPCFRDKRSGLDFVSEVLGIEFSQDVYTDSASLQRLVYIAKRDGYDVIIGGLATMRYASEIGIEFCELVSSEEEVSEAIENAKSVAQSQRERKAASQRYQTIIDAASDGIIAVDQDGSITTINHAARRMLNIKRKDVQSSVVTRLLHQSALSRVLENEKPIHDKIEKINNEMFLFNHIPVMLDNEIIGVVSSFKEASNVIRAENKVRRTLAKGFVARYGIEDLIYDSPAMSKVANSCREFATTDSCILISGETGTGKEILAQSIHNLSRRKTKPFVSVHCGALPEQLLESELFGYEEGAFTGTKKGGKPGLFELAHQGTIFLDEIDSTSLSVQLHLLRVLQEKEVMRLGAVYKVPIKVRVLAAAGKDLWEAVQNGAFRKDLFFRLNVLRISIPPLRERKMDIPKLLHHFLSHYAKTNSIKLPVLPRSYVDRLMNYSWPGNVRQIKHFSESLILNCGLQCSDDTLHNLFNELSWIVESEPRLPKQPTLVASLKNDVFTDFNKKEALPSERTHSELTSVEVYSDLMMGDKNSKLMGASGNGSLKDSFGKEGFHLTHSSLEASHIYAALQKTKYNRTKAAELLGIGRTTLWRKMKELKID